MDGVAEVVVIGGGVVGLSIAYHLAERGVRDVVVLEAGRCGEGSTLKATGGIRHQFGTAINVRCSLLALPFWRRFDETFGARASFREIGYLFLQTSPALLADMVANSTNREGYAHADVEFHLAVYAASHNVLLRQFGSVVADFMYASFNVQQATAADDEVFLEDAETHAAVFHAINGGNGERAADAMLRVVLDGKNALIKALSEQRDGAS